MVTGVVIVAIVIDASAAVTLNVAVAVDGLMRGIVPVYLL